MKEYLDPCSPNIGLNPDFKQEKKTHVQPDERGLAAAPRMNNDKLSTDKKNKDSKSFIVM